MPIPVRVQRHGETLSDAAFALYRAAKTKQAQRMFIIATEDQSSLFPPNLPKEVIVIPSATLGISRIISSIRKGEERTNHLGQAEYLDGYNVSI